MERDRKQAAFLTQCHILIRRSSLHLFRDVSNYWLRIAIFLVAALSLGTIFFDISSSDASIQVTKINSSKTWHLNHNVDE